MKIVASRSTCLLTLLVMLLCANSHGALFVNGSSDAAHVSLGANYAGSTLAISGTAGGVPFTESGVWLNPYNVLLTAHECTLSGYAVIFTNVCAGTNYNSPMSSAGVLNYVVMPGYNSDGSTPDLAIIHLPTPLPLPTGISVGTNGGIASFSPLSFSSINNNLEGLIGAGFGLYGTPTSGLNAQDGNLRGWTAPANTYAEGFNNDYYFSTLYDSSGHLGALNGEGAARDSGGGWYDSAGNLVGISDAVGTGYTIIESLSAATITAWIQSNLFVPPTLNFQTTDTNLVLSWTNGFALQSSTNAVGPFADVINAVSPYTNAMTAPQMFFRLRSTP